jgi:NADH-quinone oxidoreductase subunit G
VVAMSPYQHGAVDYAHVLLPVAPFTETAGTFISTEGRVQSFTGVVRPLGETRPAWKVLRVLGNLLGLAGFEQDSAEEVRREALGEKGVEALLDNRLKDADVGTLAAPAGGVQRIAEVPIYSADAIARRAGALRHTRDGASPAASMPRALFERLGLRDGDGVRLRQGGGEAVLPAAIDDSLPADCVRVAAGRPETAALGAASGEIALERVPAREKVAV